jgi:DNA helicase II / ATP-dependent DNA helicase PcrA
MPIWWACLLGVDHLVLSKYTPGARDSWGVPVLLMLMGGASADRDRGLLNLAGRVRKASCGRECLTVRRCVGLAPQKWLRMGRRRSVKQDLQQEKPITHQVLFDESFVLLCARALAYLLEPKAGVSEDKQVADLLDLCATAYSAKGKETHRKSAAKLRSYAIQLRAGKSPAYKCVGAARSLLGKLAGDPWSGVPRKDWVTAKNALRSSGDSLLQNMASGLDYVVAFARGQRINDALSDIWMSNGSYVGARGALDSALAQDQLIAGDETLSGLHVMNIHKAKGKQFDGVILLRLQYESPFVWRDEAAPYEQGRRLLHMALTRARKHVLIVNQIFPACPILKMHKLV